MIVHFESLPLQSSTLYVCTV